MSGRSVVSCAAVIGIALLLGGCDGGPSEEAAAARPVRTITVEPASPPSAKTFTGVIEAKDSVALSFRISGRLAERAVGVGATVKDGQLIARLDPENELNNLRSARAAVTAAAAALRQATNQHDRQKTLFQRNVTSQADLEAAEQGERAARAQLEAAEARAESAQLLVEFTTLEADAPGIVTAVGAEPGEVVSAGRPIVQLARRDGRDAVFEIPADALPVVHPYERVQVTLAGAADATATGIVREVAPQADPVTRTFRVRVGLTDPPASFRLGSTVIGAVAAQAPGTVAVPASALIAGGPEAGVWVVDADKLTVSRRKVEVVHTDPATAFVAAGLTPGDIVVTAGTGLLKEGQAIRLLGAEL